MNRRLGVLVGVAAVAVAAASFVVGSARAEDAAGMPQMPPPQKKIECPLAKALLGDWAITTSMMGQTGSAKSKIAMALDDTAMTEDYTGSFMGTTFVGHGVIKVADDAKSLTVWWFDTTSPGPTKLSGPLTATGYEISGETPRGPMKITMKKVDGGFDFAMFEGEQSHFTQQYRKAK